jgi:hypothetical protein
MLLVSLILAALKVRKLGGMQRSLVRGARLVRGSAATFAVLMFAASARRFPPKTCQPRSAATLHHHASFWWKLQRRISNWPLQVALQLHQFWSNIERWFRL